MSIPGFYIAWHPSFEYYRKECGGAIYKVGHTQDLRRRLYDSCYITNFSPDWKYIATFETKTAEDAKKLETNVLEFFDDSRPWGNELVTGTQYRIVDIVWEIASELKISAEKKLCPHYPRPPPRVSKETVHTSEPIDRQILEKVKKQINKKRFKEKGLVFEGCRDLRHFLKDKQPIRYFYKKKDPTSKKIFFYGIYNAKNGTLDMDVTQFPNQIFVETETAGEFEILDKGAVREKYEVIVRDWPKLLYTTRKGTKHTPNKFAKVITMLCRPYDQRSKGVRGAGEKNAFDDAQQNGRLNLEHWDNGKWNSSNFLIPSCCPLECHTKPEKKTRKNK